MFMIQMKKAVHKPFEAPYFVSSDYRVASWYYYHYPQPYKNSPASLSLVKVTPGFETIPVEPDRSYENQDCSPDFHVAPVYIYGTHETFRMPDGTIYYNWFEPSRWVLSKLTGTEIETSNVNALAKVNMNMWHYHHIFKNWSQLPVKVLQKT